MDGHAEPPQPGSTEHWALWLEKYGDDYATDNERRGAYQDFRTNLTTVQDVFSQPDHLRAAGYLAAHERVADGDTESPDDAELWRGKLQAFRARQTEAARAMTQDLRR